MMLQETKREPSMRKEKRLNRFLWVTDVRDRCVLCCNSQQKDNDNDKHEDKDNDKDKYIESTFKERS